MYVGQPNFEQATLIAEKYVKMGNLVYSWKKLFEVLY